MKQKLLIFSLLFASFSNLSAQRGNYVFTRADTINTINNFVYQVMADWKVPACAITIVKDGKPYHSSAFGQRNIAKNLPATVNTLFGVASCTKSFTAAALAILVDEGKLDWDKPVKTYMPDFQLYDQEASSKITARDLLSHRTGLPNHDDMWVAANSDRKTLFDNLKYLKPTHPLYTHYQYNNLMYMAAGVLVERLSGKTWEAFVKEKILIPLDMKSTVLTYPEYFKSPEYASTYDFKKEQNVEVGFGSNVDAIGPAGSMKTNMVDMTNWLLMQLQNGKFNGKQIVSEKNLRENHTPLQIVLPATAKYPELGFATYGMGWNLNTYRGQQRHQHSGSIDGFRSLMTVFPNNDFGIFVSTNTDAAQRYAVNIITNYIADNLLKMNIVDWNDRFVKERNDAQFEEEKAKKEHNATRKMAAMMSHGIDYYTGVYEHPAYGTLQIFKTDRGLRGVFHNKQFDLNHFHYDFFEGSEMLDGVMFNFPTNQKGDIDRLIGNFPESGEVEFIKRK